MATTLISIDVWDTLLRRRCHPDEVKLHTARVLSLRHARRVRPWYSTPWAVLMSNGEWRQKPVPATRWVR